MAIFTGLNISASGLTAQQIRMDILSQNIANVDTTRTEDGTPYRRKNVVFAEKSNSRLSSFSNVLTAATKSIAGQGVKVVRVIEDTKTAMKMTYDPSHPDADENGYVTYPNVNPITEMTDLIDATRSYEANVTAFNATKAMLAKGLEVGK
ncbi:MAG: flagellar basal body rod protein FlgC [Alistipes sp.]|nr:flagellar basal body rod protein FlgC [Alistipes sp.]